MAITKTKINKRMRSKTNPYLAEAIFLAKKAGLVELAAEISVPTKKQASVNLTKINNAKGEALIVPGKVLSSGEVKRKVKVYALGISKKAEEKLTKAGGQYINILNALRKGDKIKGEIIK